MSTQQERATGFEPVTSSLEGWHSTTELRPHFACHHTWYRRQNQPVSHPHHCGTMHTVPNSG